MKDNFLITETKQFHQLEKGFSLFVRERKRRETQWRERKLSFLSSKIQSFSTLLFFIIPKNSFLIQTFTTTTKKKKGFSLLEERKLSFDLQCNPSQLFGAFFLCQKYPNVPVVLDHLGHPRFFFSFCFVLFSFLFCCLFVYCYWMTSFLFICFLFLLLLIHPHHKTPSLLFPTTPRHLTGDPKIDEPTLTIWRKGMNKLASLPHIHVKLSMLGYSIPNWNKDPKKEEYAKKIVLEVIDLFGVERCMFASNWPVDKGDGWSSLGELYQKYLGWVDHFSEEEKDYLFWRTANQFYRLEE